MFLLDTIGEEMVDDEEKDDAEIFEPIVDSSKLTFDKHEGLFPISCFFCLTHCFQGIQRISNLSRQRDKMGRIFFYLSVAK